MLLTWNLIQSYQAAIMTPRQGQNQQLLSKLMFGDGLLKGKQFKGGICIAVIQVSIITFVLMLIMDHHIAFYSLGLP